MLQGTLQYVYSGEWEWVIWVELCRTITGFQLPEDFLNESPTDMEMEIETVSTQKEYGQKKEAEGDVWMLLTFALKKSMKLLHCSSVASTGEDDHIFFLFHLYECSYSSHAGKHTHG